MQGMLQPGHDACSAGAQTPGPAVDFTLLQHSLQMHIEPAPQTARILQAAGQNELQQTLLACAQQRSSPANLLHCRGINKEARDKMQGGHNIFSNDVESRPVGKAGVKVRGQRVPDMHVNTIWETCVVASLPNQLRCIPSWPACWQACLQHKQLFVTCQKLNARVSISEQGHGKQVCTKG